MWINLLISLGLMILGYVLMPKPKQQRPDSTTELESPTAEAGRPIAVIFGEVTVKSGNFLGWWNKYYKEKGGSDGKKK